MFGTGKMAEIAHAYMARDKTHEVVAFTADRQYVNAKKFRGLPLVPFEEVEKHYPPGSYGMFIAIGQKNMNKARARKYAEAKVKGYRLATYVSPDSRIWTDAKFGDNCFILENQVMQPGIEIGNNTILWSGNHLGHDVRIGDHVFIASHVVLSGNVRVGDYSFIGVNATIRNDVTVGARCLIGAGALILKNAGDGEVYVQQPTKKYPLDSEKFVRMFECQDNV